MAVHHKISRAHRLRNTALNECKVRNTLVLVVLVMKAFRGLAFIRESNPIIFVICTLKSSSLEKDFANCCQFVWINEFLIKKTLPFTYFFIRVI